MCHLFAADSFKTNLFCTVVSCVVIVQFRWTILLAFWAADLKKRSWIPNHRKKMEQIWRKTTVMVTYFDVIFHKYLPIIFFIFFLLFSVEVFQRPIKFVVLYHFLDFSSNSQNDAHFSIWHDNVIHGNYKCRTEWQSKWTQSKRNTSADWFRVIVVR